MWVAKIKLKHDCIVGNRCEEFNVILQSYDLNEEKEKDKVLTSSLHQMIGKKEDIKRFVNSLRKDKKTEFLEVNKNTLFLVESAKNKPVSSFSKKMFFVKPVVIDNEGVEHWEIASHKREELTQFINNVEPLCDRFTLMSIRNSKLGDIYFPKVLPKLTDLQKRAFEIAIEEGYYSVPKKTSLRKLAKHAGVSLATYQRHLQKAESKVIPDILSYLK